MNTIIRSRKMCFKITDLLGLITLVYPFVILFFEHKVNLLFYIFLLLSIRLITFNFFGLAGYYVKLDANKIYFFDQFIPYSIKISNIIDIEKLESKIVLKTIVGKEYTIDLNKIDKKERFKTTDLFYDIHNKIQSKSAKDIEKLS